MIISLKSPLYQKALDIRREVFVVEQNVPEELEVDEHEAVCEHFLIFKDQLAASTGRLRIKGEFIKFERIATLKKFRGMGQASLLMTEMMDHAKTHHPKLLPYMHAQLDVVPFYEKRGWTAFGDVFYEASIAHRAMKWRQG